MKKISQVLNWLSSLKIAILLLLLIAISCAAGTLIPQQESNQFYYDNFNKNPFLGIINANILLLFEFDHVYTSFWFLFLLIWLGLALSVCSFRRQLPILKSALNWIDYKSPRQIAKLSVAQTIVTNNCSESLEKIKLNLKKQGWNVKETDGRIAARQGVIGRLGPILIHLGMILLMIGATYGSLNGKTIEKFLAPGRSIDLLNNNEEKGLTIELQKFQIERDPQGRAEQYKSIVNVIEPNGSNESKEISVNYPLRYKGLTLYQADWSLAAITIQIDNSPKLQIPIEPISELGEQVWGTVIPTNKDGKNQILLTVDSELGPVNIYDNDGTLLTKLSINKEEKVKGALINIINIIPSSGLLLKHDPGVPLVYLSFAIILIGGSLSIISTKKIWVLHENEKSMIYIGGLSNRNLSGLSKELPNLISFLEN
ncbi:putative c-type cytochrome biogenesis protein Ccs1 [Prochlorococcus marinus str. NATL1A]|uniref:Cytochrome c biogenesis protein CcsB n=1 Tax=Prochlorococcus marinus (strain NATL1A) TaxID=167555 RepID=CCS1_PROM1|nr:cytochrome c biogenesis protein ResB [Prochlorococcus marinus]A2C4K5.1 RecName: Full=Cytochrome c biogenesis protein CcsB [Prochlorococcus marinus str. NATL1A]ABM76415.1 putative c-type cytochrome biogenesis protein Ccs1 [Prochlorococcus marinus str. NATL1A]